MVIVRCCVTFFWLLVLWQQVEIGLCCWRLRFYRYSCLPRDWPVQQLPWRVRPWSCAEHRASLSCSISTFSFDLPLPAGGSSQRRVCSWRSQRSCQAWLVCTQLAMSSQHCFSLERSHCYLKLGTSRWLPSDTHCSPKASH